MAVKVMLAPAIAKREVVPAPGAPSDAKPKRRRHSVYDADGNEVFITIVCLKCHRTRPLAQFGLRRMADGAIRNQPWCKSCRSSGAERPRRGARDTATDPVTTAAADVPMAAATREEPVDAGRMAAQIVAALHAGRR